MRLVRTVLSPSSRSRLVAAAVIPFVVAMGLAGCADPSASSGASGSASDAAAAKKAADADLEKSWAGTDRALPTSSPAVAKDKNVWIISCGQTAEGCAAGARGATEAGKKLGWKMTLVDGKFNVQTWNSGIRQAVADQADAVMLDIVDCGPVKGALAEAKKAGVKIYAWYSFDCDDGDSGAEPMFDAQVTYGGDYPTFVDWLYGYGGSMAEYIISETDGKAKVIQFTHEELRVVHYIEKGFEKRMKECDSCEVLAEQDITLADLGTTLQQKTATLLSRYPQANAVEGMYDSAISLGIGAAVMASGRNDDLVVTGGEGFGPNVGLVRDDKGQDFYAGSPSTWTGWAAVDGLNRLFNGADQVDAGIGFQGADRDHNLPAKNESYDGNVVDGKPRQDYRANYLKIWGVA